MVDQGNVFVRISAGFSVPGIFFTRRNEYDINNDLRRYSLQCRGREIAVLLKRAKVCHVAYLKLGEPATGLFSDDYSIRRKLLNGVKRTRRLNGSGIKHSKFNKFYLKMQRSYLDHDPPYLIIFPLLSLEDIVGWDGVKPYSALVLPCGHKGRSVATDILFKVREVSTEGEVRNAVETLAVFVKDIAESLLDTDHYRLEDFDEIIGSSNDVSIVRWQALVRHLRHAFRPTISIPVLKNNLDFQTIGVAKGTFNLNESCLPDPYRVAIKAAINFSAHVGTKLMPACPKYETHQDDLTNLLHAIIIINNTKTGL